MRGDRPLSEMGFMSPQFKALAASQDIIGWREFTEGHISTHFYAIQSFHLAMSSSYLNGEDWTKPSPPDNACSVDFPEHLSARQNTGLPTQQEGRRNPTDHQRIWTSHRKRSLRTAASSSRFISQTLPNLISKLKPTGSSQWTQPLKPKPWSRLAGHGPNEFGGA